ncbi:hypothetical protein MGU_10659 [Metarhizium guizhouense ARSEF 977]|uniref:Uncharacterized protein n=1 Tax=Metarhizium guizhouense (strain ARSEF 977) TaxID=1276136 RepID=A0A0B4G5V1_METGA|nr:hypothetical protein MGU_10659 [Metarhizium guizhouense ARSEF 977]
MSRTTLISQLNDVVTSLESWVLQLDGSSQWTNDESNDLYSLSMRLATATSSVQKRVGSYKPPCRAEIWKASEPMRRQARSAVEDLVRDRAFNQPAMFRRNITLIFGGPKFSEFDSSQMKSRKLATITRCERLRRLEADKVVAWAVSYKSTSWAVGCMGSDMFDCLAEAVESNTGPWPPVVSEVLYKLQKVDLQESTEYISFLQGEPA